jgi:hypothetical protein
MLEFCGDVINFGCEQAGEYQEPEGVEESQLLFCQGRRNHGNNISERELEADWRVFRVLHSHRDAGHAYVTLCSLLA